MELRGEGFRTDTQVEFGRVPAAAVHFYNGSKILAEAPPHDAGPVTVTVSNPGVPGEGTLEGFEFVAPLRLDLDGIEAGDLLARGAEEEMTVSGSITGGKAPYEVEIARNENDTTRPDVAGGSFQKTLEAGDGRHYVVAMVRDALGYRDWVSFHYLKDSRPPGRAGSVRAFPLAGGKGVRLFWEAPGAGDLALHRVALHEVGEDGPAATPVAEQDLPWRGRRTVSHRFTGLSEGQRYEARIIAIDRVGNEGEPATARLGARPFVDFHSLKRRIAARRLSLSNDPASVRHYTWGALSTMAELRHLRRMVEELGGGYRRGGARRRIFSGYDACGEGGEWPDTSWDSVRVPRGGDWTGADYPTRAARDEISNELGRISRWRRPWSGSWGVTEAGTSEHHWSGGSEHGWKEAFDATWWRGGGLHTNVPHSPGGFYGSRGHGFYEHWIWNFPGEPEFSDEFEFWHVDMTSISRTYRLRFTHGPPALEYFWTDHGRIDVKDRWSRPAPGDPPEDPFRILEKVFPGGGRLRRWSDPAANTETDDMGPWGRWTAGSTSGYEGWGEVTDNLYVRRWQKTLSQDDDFAADSVSITPRRTLLRAGETTAVQATVRYVCRGWGAGNGKREPWEEEVPEWKGDHPGVTTGADGAYFYDTGARNGARDPGEPYVDRNANHRYDAPEPFTDYDEDDQWDDGEYLDDTNGNGRWDPIDFWFMDFNGNNRPDPGEYYDANSNGQYDAGEDFDDENGNGVWDGPEPYEDLNGNERWDDGEPFTDEDALRVSIPTTIRCTGGHVCNQGAPTFTPTAPGTYTLTTPQGGSATVRAIRLDLDVAGIDEQYEKNPGAILPRAEMPEGKGWADLSPARRNRLRPLARTVRIEAEVDAETEQAGTYVLAVGPGALLLDASATVQVLPTPAGRRQVSFEGTAPAKRYKLLATGTGSTSARVDFTPAPQEPAPDLWEWWYPDPYYMDPYLYPGDWFYHPTGQTHPADRVRVEVMDTAPEVAGAWAHEGSLRDLETAIDRQNRRIYVALPPGWDASSGRAYLVIPGGVMASGAGARSLRVSGAGATPLRQLPELVSDLAREDTGAPSAPPPPPPFPFPGPFGPPPPGAAPPMFFPPFGPPPGFFPPFGPPPPPQGGATPAAHAPPGPYRHLPEDLKRRRNERAATALRLSAPGRRVVRIRGEAQKISPDPAGNRLLQTAADARDWTLAVHLLDLSMQEVPEEDRAAQDAPHETDPGAVVGLNDNDNAGAPGTTDSEEQSLAAPDTDLRTLALTLAPLPRSGTVSLSVPEGVRLWTDRRKTARVRGRQWQMPADRADLLHALGAAPGAAEVDVELAVEGLQPGEAGHLELSRTSVPGGPPAATDRIRLTVAQADLDADTDYDGRIAEADDPAEATGYGFLLGVNDNDDDGDGQVDWSNRQIDGPADRAANVRALRISPAPDAAATGTFRLTTGGSDHVRIFDDQDAPVIGPRAGNAVEIPAGDLPDEGLTYRMEALSAGKEVEVELTLQREDGTRLHTDRVKVSTLGAAVAGAYSADVTASGEPAEEEESTAPRPPAGAVSALFSIRSAAENTTDGMEAAAGPGAQDEDPDGVSLPTARAVNVRDSGGRRTGRWFVPVSTIGEHRPCVPLLNFKITSTDGTEKTLIPEEVLDGMQRGELSIFDAQGNTGDAFKDAIKGSESFEHFVNLVRQIWQWTDILLRALGYDAGEREQMIGPRPDEHSIYQAVRAAFGVDGENEKYFWTTPPIEKLGHHRFTIRRDMDSQAAYKLTVTVFSVDLDIDSDNMNGLERSPQEDRIEDIADRPGKILRVNDQDLDGDGIRDYADGYNRYDNAMDTGARDDQITEPDASFCPVVLEISDGVDPAKAVARFNYPDSDPSGVSVQNDDIQQIQPGQDGLASGAVVVSAGEDGQLDTTPAAGDELSADETQVLAGSNGVTDTEIGARGYSPAQGDGKIRLWLADASQPRKGKYIVPGTAVPFADLYQPDPDDERRRRVFLEGVRAGLASIHVEVDRDGAEGPQAFMAKDTVRTTVTGLEFVQSRETQNAPGTDILPLFNPNPRVEITDVSEAEGNANPTVRVSGIVTTYVAPPDRSKVFVNGLIVEKLDATGVEGANGPDGLGPFRREFLSPPIPVGNGNAVITAWTISALEAYGADSALIVAEKAPDGAVTGREVIPQPSVPAQQPQPDEYRFRIEYSASAPTEESTCQLKTSAGVRTIALHKTADKVQQSQDLYLIPANVTWPDNVPDKVKATRIPTSFKVQPQALYEDGEVGDTGILAGVLTVNHQRRAPLLAAVAETGQELLSETQEVAPQHLLDNAFDIVAGLPGASGKTVEVELLSRNQEDSAVVPRPDLEIYAPVRQNITLYRQSDDPNAEEFHLYTTNDPSRGPGEGTRIVGFCTETPSGVLSGETHAQLVMPGGYVKTRLPAEQEELSIIAPLVSNTEYVAGMMPVDRDGDPVRGTVFSDPSPQIELDETSVDVTIVNDHPWPAEVTAYVSFQGAVTDPICDVVEEGNQYLTIRAGDKKICGPNDDGSDDPIDREMEYMHNNRSVFRPYAFRGEFGGTVAVKVVEGENTVVIEAENAVGNLGWATISFNAHTEVPDPEQWPPNPPVASVSAVSSASMSESRGDSTKMPNGSTSAPGSRYDSISSSSDWPPPTSLVGEPQINDGPIASSVHNPVSIQVFDFTAHEQPSENANLAADADREEEEDLRAHFGTVDPNNLKRLIGHKQLRNMVYSILKKRAESLPREVLEHVDVYEQPKRAVRTISSAVGTMRTVYDYAFHSGTKIAAGTSTTHSIQCPDLRDDLPLEVVISKGLLGLGEDQQLMNAMEVRRDGNTLHVDLDIPRNHPGGVRTIEATYGDLSRWFPWDRITMKGSFEVTDLRIMVIALDGVSYEDLDHAINKIQSGDKNDDVLEQVADTAAPLLEYFTGDQPEVVKALMKKVFVLGASGMVSTPTTFGKIVGPDYQNCAQLNEEHPRSVRNFLPSVTWCNWSSIFTGAPPKETGITGLPFLARELGDAPIWSAGTCIGFSDIENPTAQDYQDRRYILDLWDQLRVGVGHKLDESGSHYLRAETLYEKAQAHGADSAVVMNVIRRGATPVNYGGVRYALAANAAAGFLAGNDFLPLPPRAKAWGVGKQHGDLQGAFLDFGGARGAMGQVLKREIPDIITCYLAGPDAVAHGEGDGAGREHLWKWTDTAFALPYEVLRRRGYDTATLFVFVSDHGMNDSSQSGFGANTNRKDYDRTVVALEDKDGLDDDIGPLLGGPAGPQLQVWGWPDADDLVWDGAASAYSPNGGMAHIYLRKEDMSVPWRLPGSADSDLNWEVASQLVERAHTENDGLQNRFAAVLYKAEDDVGWDAPYMWAKWDAEDKKVRSKTIQNLAAWLGQQQEAQYKGWNIQTRIDELRGSRSGDVALIFGEKDGTRHIGWHWDFERYRGWHGEPSEAVSRVPLIFAFTGGELDFINQAIQDAERVSDVPGDITNADLTPIILKILERTR